MKKTIFIFTLIFTFSIIDAIAQIKPKLWYDGNSRVFLYRDALSSNLLNNDTVSSKSKGSGFTNFDLGFHLNPIDDIEISSEIRVENQFGGMWGNESDVKLRTLSAQGIINGRIGFQVGDFNLKQSKYLLYNYSQEFSEYESLIFKDYKDYINYENFYQSNSWRLQGIRSSFSYNFYNQIEELSFDLFTSRVKGQEWSVASPNWAGSPELLMSGIKSKIKLSSKTNITSTYINSYNLPSTSINSINVKNSVISTRVSKKLKIINLPSRIDFELGVSNKNWSNVENAPELTGKFMDIRVKSAFRKINFNSEFRYVEANFRSSGAQTRRVNFNQGPSAYPFYSNNSIPRQIGLLDILTDPTIYNQTIQTQLAYYNPIYGSIEPYGNATPNRIGLLFELENKSIIPHSHIKFKTKYFSEIIGEGTNKLKKFYKNDIVFSTKLNKLFKFDKRIDLYSALSNELVKRNGISYEIVDLNTIFFNTECALEIIDKFYFVLGYTQLYSKGKDFISVRDEYDVVVDFDELNIDLYENIFSFGFMHMFSEKIYFTIKHNSFNIIDNTKQLEEFNINRLQFIFNMNL